MRVLALASSDWHVSDSSKGYIPPEIQRDIDTLLDLILAEAERLQPKCFMLAGDIFDTRHVSGESLAKCARFVNRCNDLGCRVLFVQGQHDLNKTPILSSVGCSNAVYLNGLLSLYCVDGCWIGGLDFSYKPLPPISCDILVTHQNWKRPNWPFGIQEPLPVLEKKKLVISGDWHEHVIFDLSSDMPKILSPGPLIPQRLSEPKTCRIWAIYDDLSYSSVQIPSRRWFDYIVNDTDDIDRFVAEINSYTPASDVPDALSMPACVLRYKPNLHSSVIKAIASMRAICIPVMLRDDNTRASIKPITSERFDIRQIITKMYCGSPMLNDIETILFASGPADIRNMVKGFLGENGSKISREIGQ